MAERGPSESGVVGAGGGVSVSTVFLDAHFDDGGV